MSVSSGSLVMSQQDEQFVLTCAPQSTTGFGFWAGLIFILPLVHVLKRIKWQVIVNLVFTMVFTAALSTVNRNTKSQAVAFSFLTALPIAFLEIAPTIMVQLDAEDMDVCMAYCKVSSTLTRHNI